MPQYGVRVQRGAHTGPAHAKRKRGPWIKHSPDGTVNLIGSDRDKAQEGRSHEGLCPSGHAGDLGPGLEGLGPGGSILGSRKVSASEVEQVVDPIVGGKEALGLAS